MSRELADSSVRTGVIIVDHGSRRQSSNDMLLKAAEAFAAQSPYSIVEPAHMELAEPDIATAFSRCVERGAHRVIVFPYFLSTGRHWKEDIPRMVRDAARNHPDTEWLVTAPFALHPDLLQIINDRIEDCLQRALGTTVDEHCDACEDGQQCRLFRSAD
ncbi:MAG: CbiX/SirB N-terminal domain-containing protein [Planctomycetaceae bacterium]